MLAAALSLTQEGNDVLTHFFPFNKQEHNSTPMKKTQKQARNTNTLWVVFKNTPDRN